MKKLSFLLIAALISIAGASPAFSYSLNSDDVQVLKVPLHPVPDMTPGDVCDKKDPDFDGYRYSQKIPYCTRNVSNETKAQVYEAYNIPEAERREYTIDHFIPLSIGGSNQEDNLWPEHKRIKRQRLTLEQEIYEAVKNGEMSQENAIQTIVEAKMNPGPLAQ
jgi:hypothetical protein